MTASDPVSYTHLDTGYTGKIETLAFKIQADFNRVLNRTNENAPAFEIFCGDLRICLLYTSAKTPEMLSTWSSCHGAMTRR